MSTVMTKAVRDDLAKLAYRLAGDLPADDRKALLAVFAREKDMPESSAFALYARGKILARLAKARAA